MSTDHTYPKVNPRVTTLQTLLTPFSTRSNGRYVIQMIAGRFSGTGMEFYELRHKISS